MGYMYIKALAAQQGYKTLTRVTRSFCDDTYAAGVLQSRKH